MVAATSPIYPVVHYHLLETSVCLLPFILALSLQGLQVRLGPQGLPDYKDPQVLLDLQDFLARMDNRDLWGCRVRC